MKYSKTALGLLNAQYRSVLKKCFLINMGLFALGALTAAPANATSETIEGESFTTPLHFINYSGEDLSFSDSVYKNNTKTGGSGNAKFGNIAFVYEGSKITYTNSTFEGNTSDYVGGVLGSYSTGILDVSGSTFKDNHAHYDGGAIGNYGGLKILGSTFEGNTADYDKDGDDNYTVVVADNTAIGGGAISLGSISSTSIGTISDTTFKDNKSGTYGGAIGTRFARDGDNSAAKLDIDATFTGNSAVKSGGAIYNTFYADNGLGKGDGVTVKGEFTSNSAGEKGGAIYNDGTTTTKNPTVSGVMTVNDSTFKNNTAQYGSAIYNTGTLTVNDSLFKDNTAARESTVYNSGTLTIIDSDFDNNTGGGIYNDRANVTLTDTSFTNNTSEEYGAIYNWGAESVLTINAENDDVIFSGNVASEDANAGDIYNSKGNIYLNAADGRTISMDGGISSDFSASNNHLYINSAEGSSGTVNLAGALRKQTVAVSGGELALSKGTASGSNLTGSSVSVASGATLNSEDGVINNYASKITLADGSRVKADAKLSNETADTFTIESGSNVILTDLKILDDKDGATTISLANAGHIGIATNVTNLYTSSYKYSVTGSGADDGDIVITNNGVSNLKIVSDATSAGERENISFSITSNDSSVTTDTSITNADLSISGAGTGAGDNGITLGAALKVADTSTLTVENAKIGGTGSIENTSGSEFSATDSELNVNVTNAGEATIQGTTLAAGKTFTNQAGAKALVLNSIIDADVNNAGIWESDPTTYTGTYTNTGIAAFDDDTFASTATLDNFGDAYLYNGVTFENGAEITGVGDLILSSGTTHFNNTANENDVYVESGAKFDGKIIGGTVDTSNNSLDTGLGSVNGADLFIEASLAGTGSVDEFADATGSTVKEINILGNNYGTNGSVTLNVAGATVDENVQINGANYYTDMAVSGGQITLSNKLINSSTLNNELGTWAAGNYVGASDTYDSTTNSYNNDSGHKTVGEAIAALDTGLGAKQSGTYISNTASVNTNLKSLDTQVKANADDIADNTGAIDDILDDITVITAGTYISTGHDVAGNLGALDTQVKANADAIDGLGTAAGADVLTGTIAANPTSANLVSAAQVVGYVDGIDEIANGTETNGSHVEVETASAEMASVKTTGSNVNTTKVETNSNTGKVTISSKFTDGTTPSEAKIEVTNTDGSNPTVAITGTTTVNGNEVLTTASTLNGANLDTGTVAKTALATGVQNSLDAADSALQTVTANGTDVTGTAKTVAIAQGSTNGTISVNGTDVAVKGLGTTAYTDKAAAYTQTGHRGAELASDIATYVSGNGAKVADVSTTANIITDLFNDKALYIQETTGMDQAHSVEWNYNNSSETLLHGATSMLNADEKLAGAIDDINNNITVTTAGTYISTGSNVAANLGALDTAIAGKLTGEEAADYTVSGKRGAELAANIATYVAANGDKFADVQNTANIITDLFNDKALYIQETTGMDQAHSVSYNYNQSSQELLHGATSMLNADEKLAGAITETANIVGKQTTPYSGGALDGKTIGKGTSTDITVATALGDLNNAVGGHDAKFGSLADAISGTWSGNTFTHTAFSSTNNIVATDPLTTAISGLDAAMGDVDDINVAGYNPVSPATKNTVGAINQLNNNFTNGTVNAKFASLNVNDHMVVLADGTISTDGPLNVAGVASLNGGINVNGKMAVTTDGNIATDGTLSVNGKSYLQGGINVNNKMTVDADGNINSTSLTTTGKAKVGSLQIGDTAYGIAANGDITGNKITGNTFANASNTFTVDANGNILARDIEADDIESTTLKTGTATVTGNLSAQNGNFLVDTTGTHVNGTFEVTNGANKWLDIASNGVSTFAKGDNSVVINGSTYELAVTGDTQLDGDLDVTGDATIDGDLDVTGDVDITGTLNVDDDATFGGDVDIAGDLDVTGDAAIDGDLDVGGDVDITGTLNVDDDATFGGDVDIDGDLTADGNSSFGAYNDGTGDKYALVVETTGTDGHVTVNTGLEVKGASHLDGGIYVNDKFGVDTDGNIGTKGTLLVEKLASLNGGINVNDKFVVDTVGNTGVGGNLDVDGNATIDGKLSAANGEFTVDENGNTVIKGTLGAGSNGTEFTVDGDGNVHAAGNTEIDGALAVHGMAYLTDAIVNHDLAVANDATVGGNFAVAGTSNLHDTVVDGTLATTGAATIGGDLGVQGTSWLKNTHVNGDLEVSGTTKTGALTFDGDSYVAAMDQGAAAIVNGTVDDQAKRTMATNATVAKTVGNLAALNGTHGVTSVADVASAIDSLATNVETATGGTFAADGKWNAAVTVAPAADYTYGGAAGHDDLMDFVNDLASNIGNGSAIGSKNTAINNGTATNVAAGMKAVGDAIGDMNFAGSHYVAGDNDLSSAVRTLDSNLYRVESDVRELKRDFNRGMASMAAMSALVPNPRAHGNTSLSVGAGAYSGHTAMAIGGFHNLTDNLMVNAGAAWGNSDDMSYRVGLTWSW